MHRRELKCLRQLFNHSLLHEVKVYLTFLACLCGRGKSTVLPEVDWFVFCFNFISKCRLSSYLQTIFRFFAILIKWVKGIPVKSFRIEQEEDIVTSQLEKTLLVPLCEVFLVQGPTWILFCFVFFSLILWTFLQVACFTASDRKPRDQFNLTNLNEKTNHLTHQSPVTGSFWNNVRALHSSSGFIQID